MSQYNFAYDIIKYDGIRCIEETFKQFENYENGRHAMHVFLLSLEQIGYNLRKFNNSHYEADNGIYHYEIYVSLI